MCTLRRWLATSLALASLGGFASDVQAQACLGIGALDEQGYLIGHAGLTDGAWTPGGTLGYNAPGPITVSASFDHTLLDNSDLAISAASGTLVAEFPNRRVSICPLGFGGYQWLSNKGELSDIDLGLDGFFVGGGVAIGGRLETEGGLAFIPAVSASVVHTRATLDIIGLSATGSQTFGSFTVGFAVAGGPVFIGPSLSIATYEDADLVFTGSLGVAF